MKNEKIKGEPGTAGSQGAAGKDNTESEKAPECPAADLSCQVSFSFFFVKNTYLKVECLISVNFRNAQLVLLVSFINKLLLTPYFHQLKTSFFY